MVRWCALVLIQSFYLVQMASGAAKLEKIEMLTTKINDLVEKVLNYISCRLSLDIGRCKAQENIQLQGFGLWK